MRLSLTLKVNLILVLVVLALGSALGASFVVTGHRTLHEDLDRRVQMLGSCLAVTLGDAVAHHDREAMNRALQSAVLDKELNYVMVKAPDGEILAARWAAGTRGGLSEHAFALPGPAPAGAAAQAFGPVGPAGTGAAVGELAVGVDLSVLQSALTRQVRTTALAVLAGVAVSLALGTIFVRLALSRSLRPLLAGIRAMGAGDLSQSIVPDRHAETGEIGRAFNEMARRLSSTLVTQTQLEQTVANRTADLTAALEERIRIQRDLAAREEQVGLLLDSTAEAICGVDESGRCTFCNPASLRMLGFARSGDLVGKDLHELLHHSHPDGSPRPAAACGIRAVLASGEGYHAADEVFWKADGSPLHVECWSYPIRSEGPARGAVVTFVDITERRKLEEQLLQAQKLEGIGILAGGIAHDFNNLLTPMLGYTELALQRMPEGDPSREALAAVLDAGGRAAELTRQILAFSRKQLLQKRRLDLNAEILALGKMIRRLIGEDVEVQLQLAGDLPVVNADPAQMQQVLLNLAVNARDAMPAGGTLTIDTGLARVESPSPWVARGLSPGTYVRVTVSDTGTGMDEQTRLRVFEPFFTTKEVGKGTGLGLSTVHGIVKQHGGDISLYSEPGRGTTFRIYLPCATEAPVVEPPPPPPAARGAGAWVLLVEDEELVRNFVEEVLVGHGYRVSGFASPSEALKAAAAAPFDLVISDVIMPEMNGRQLCEQIARLRPESRFLFVSGYPSGSGALADLFSDGAPLLQKPFSAQRLLAQVATLMEQPG